MTTIFNSSFGGGTISLSEFVNAKEGLRKTPATVVTQIDGKRFVESYDGTRTEISSQSADEDGKWAVMDDNAALGLAEEEFKSATTSSPDLSSINHNLGDVPSLGPYLRLLQVGVPLEVVKSKVVADENSGGLPKGTLERFKAGVEKATEGGGGQSSESEKAVVFMEGTHAEKHGWLGDPSWEAPHMAVNCDVEARAGYNSAKSHEFLDSPEVLREKVKLLALLFRKAKRPVVYAGAGLSTASGIGDYATQTGQSGVLAQRKKKQAEQAEREEASAAVRGGGSAGEASASGRNPSSAKKASGVSSLGKQILSAMTGTSPFCAKPNLGHQSLAALAQHGYVWRFVQQNHDGLPQKAGMPQHLVNEIHGGWFDPSNPVVAMSGALRTDLFDDLLLCEKQTDLVLAVGTSLCGMNADRLVKTAAGKARREREDRKAVSEATAGKVVNEPRRSLSSLLSFTDRKSAAQPTAAAAAAAAAAAGSTLPAAELPNQVAFGSVIVSLQQTVHDHNCSLRIFGLIDDVLSLLAEELLRGDGENLPPPTSEQKPEAKRGEEDVFYVPYHETSGKRAQGGGGGRLTKLDLREGAELTVSHGPDAGSNAVVTGKNLDGHWRLSVERRLKSGRAFQETRLLGKWWPFEAEQGLVPYIPVVPRAADA